LPSRQFLGAPKQNESPVVAERKTLAALAESKILRGINKIQRCIQLLALRKRVYALLDLEI